jgi:TonB-linked SusC/RagA family outer membrane protein
MYASKNVEAQTLHEIQIQVDTNKANLTELFELVEKQTEFRFVYPASLKRDVKASFNFYYNSISVAGLLTEVGAKTGLWFRQMNSTIAVNTENVWEQAKKEEIISPDQLQTINISGQVTDAVTAEPLIGVNILIEGTTIGTSTDENGQFELEVPEDATMLIVSYLGFERQEVLLSENKVEYLIELVPDNNLLDEVVVIGYGTDTKEKFNGAVSGVDGTQVNNYSSANFDQSLAGAFSGIQIIGNNKNPGENSVIQIRGLNTITAGTSPLIVVDGIPLTEGSSLSSINPNDIESVSVLKDAASAAIYGSRASNGVILVTTKNGMTESGLSIEYDSYFGVQQRADNFKLADAYDTALFDYDARNYGYISGGEGRSITDDNATRDANGGGKRSRIPDYLQAYIDGNTGLTNTDWVDETFRDASMQNQYLNVSGGNEDTNFSISLGYLGQENIIIDSDFQRYTSSIRFNSKKGNIRFGISSNTSMVNSKPTGNVGWSRSNNGRGSQADPAFSVILMQPYYPVYNADGSLAISKQLEDNNQNWDGPISENVIAQAKLSDYTRESFRAFGNAFIEYEPIADLTLKTSFNGDYSTSVNEYFGPSTFGNYRTPVASNPTQAHKYDGKRENFMIENLLNYQKMFDINTFDLLLGYSYQQEFGNLTDLNSRNFADDNLRNIGGATTINSSSRSNKWALESYFSRLQYSYDNRYSMSASIRRDGSSRFGENTKYGNFASLTGGWTISNESFFPKSDLISFAKFRVSWGQTGNNQIGDFASIALVSPDNYVINGVLTPGVYTSTSPNADLSWETNTALNYGLDLGLLQDKIILKAEYYTSKTTDLLLDVPVPQQSGFSESLQNIGELKNSGFEFELRGQGFNLGELQIGFNANFSTNKNEVLALGGGQEQIIANNGGMDFLTKVGDPIAQFYAYDIVGVYKSQDEIDSDSITPLAGTEVGDYIVRDANGDNIITPDDRVVQGDYNPEFIYGFGFTLDYKGFDIGVQFNGIEGRKVSNRMLRYAESGEGFFVPTQYYVDNYFSERNPDGFFRRPDFSSFSSAGRLTRSSSLSVYDGDYFRLRSLQLGYTLPVDVVNKVGMKGARVYLTGNNIFNFTNYRGYNSDGLDVSSNDSQTLTRGWIRSSSPITRFLALGVNLKF